MSNEKLTEKQLSWIQDLIRRNNINPTEEEQNRIMNMDKPTASKVIDEIKATGQLNLSKIEAETKKEEMSRNEAITRNTCFQMAVNIVNKSDPEEIFDVAEGLYNEGKKRGFW